MTATITESLEHLDFRPVVPCSHSEHRNGGMFHQGDAYVMARVTCNACGDNDIVDLCRVFFESVMAWNVELKCAECGEFEPARDSYIVLHYY